MDVAFDFTSWELKLLHDRVCTLTHTRPQTHLTEMVDARFHLLELRRLQVQQVQEIGRQCVDLVGDARKRLRRIVLGLLQSMAFLLRLKLTKQV